MGQTLSHTHCLLSEEEQTVSGGKSEGRKERQKGRKEGVEEREEKEEEEEGRKISDLDPRYEEVSGLPWWSGG